MASPKELPELVSDLVRLSKDYLRQETVEPARRLGRLAGIGLAAGGLFAFATLFLGLAVLGALRLVLPEGEWWTVLGTLLAALGVGGVAGLIGWRMTR